MPILKENLQMAQNKMKQQATQHRSERQFEEGDKVYLRLQPYKQSTPRTKEKCEISSKIYWS